MDEVLNLSVRSQTKATALFSFHPLYYLYFMLAFYFVPYVIYRYIARRLGWETNPKTASRHWSDLFDGLTYGLILFMFGNYTKTFSWITVVAFYPSLFAYALIAELPFTRTSLPRIKSWPKGMWVVFLLAIAAILAFAAYHIYLASLLGRIFLICYVCSLGWPLVIIVSAFMIEKEINENWIRTKLRTLKQNHTLPEEEPVTPYHSRVAIHLHHWQIFYVLAFFTRFDHPVSQVGAGIVIACYMEGICAYGYDRLVNDG